MTTEEQQTFTTVTKHRLECDDNTKSLLIIFMCIAFVLAIIIYSINVCHESTMTAYHEDYSEIQQVGQQGTLWVKGSPYNGRK